jgi:hypothetical protein
MGKFGTSFYGFDLHLEDQPSPKAIVSLEIERPKPVELTTFECATEQEAELKAKAFIRDLAGNILWQVQVEIVPPRREDLGRSNVMDSQEEEHSAFLFPKYVYNSISICMERLMHGTTVETAKRNRLKLYPRKKKDVIDLYQQLASYIRGKQTCPKNTPESLRDAF